ncbi:MAG: peptidyl-prolyl cis-trans isomerase [Vicinamibacterales bacterium]
MRLLLALLTVAPLALPMQGEILEQVLVKVNGEIITKTELEAKQIAALRDRINSPITAEAMKSDDALKKALLDVTPDILVSAVDELLLTQLGREKGYKLSEEQFQAWLENMRKTNNLQDDQRFQAALQQEGMTLADLRKQVDRAFLVDRVRQDEVGQKLTITEEEARQYYLAHKNEFIEPASVTLREIFIEVPTTTVGGEPGVNVGAEDEAKKKADAARARVAAGEDFGKVAAEVSESASKANGGLIGPLPLADVSDALRTTLESMKPGEVTPPTRNARGFQILKLEAMTAADPQPFEAVRDLVADRVYEARAQSEMRKFLARIRSQAIIEWKNQDLKKLYEQRIAQPSN